MVSTATRNQGKTSFVKELLLDNPQANPKAVNMAWTAAGMDGDISETLVNKMRSQMGLTGNLRGASRNELGATIPTKRSAAGKKSKRKPRKAAVVEVSTPRSLGHSRSPRQSLVPPHRGRGRSRPSAFQGDEPGRTRRSRERPAGDPPTPLRDLRNQALIVFVPQYAQVLTTRRESPPAFFVY